MQVIDVRANAETNKKIFRFKGVIKGKQHIKVSNDYGFVSICSKLEAPINNSIKTEAQAIAKTIDKGNRFYTHKQANRFCVYDPKNAGIESYLDSGDAEVIRQFILLAEQKME